MDRPAPFQRKPGPVGPARASANPPEKFNIWSGKKIGREELAAKVRETRCDPERDSGKTRAVTGDPICVFFAQGRCSNGPACDFWHRIPNQDDERSLGPVNDIFGRERHATEREDMGGIGTFSRENRSLYIGRVPGGRAGVQEAVRVAFGACGDLEQVKVLDGKNCAFAKFRLRACAEFAREALAEQPLFPGSEPMNLRWATEDPNPGVRKRDAARNQAELASSLEAQGVCLTPAEFEYPSHYQLPNKRQRGEEEGGDNTGDYPDTDEQFTSYSGVAAARAAIAASRPPQGQAHGGGRGGSVQDAPREMPGGEWVQYLSPEGYPFFYCEERGSTVWQLPPQGRIIRVEVGGPPGQHASTAAATPVVAAMARAPEEPQGLAALAGYGDDSEEEEGGE